ncbi:hypothetical protein NC651_008491 [Populus alba x Populus x berolinensis]|nr:hypothetical protein NC651_008491 [Populus alba x Populus x berolinensis]
MLGIRQLTLPRKETAETSHVMSVPGVKSIVADQISHAVQSTSNRLHLIQQPSPSHAKLTKLPRNLLAKASTIKNIDQILQN